MQGTADLDANFTQLRGKSWGVVVKYNFSNIFIPVPSILCDNMTVAQAVILSQGLDASAMLRGARATNIAVGEV